jgi:hypothetical protein
MLCCGGDGVIRQALECLRPNATTSGAFAKVRRRRYVGSRYTAVRECGEAGPVTRTTTRDVTWGRRSRLKSQAVGVAGGGAALQFTRDRDAVPL